MEVKGTMSAEFVRVKHKVINKDGWSLWLPGMVVKGLDNLNEPDIYTESTTQLYPLGAKLEFADGRVFRYGKFGASSTEVPYARMLFNANHQAEMTGYEDTEGFHGDLYTAAVAGDKDMDLEIATAYAENWFEGGHVVIFADTTNAFFMQYRIAGNDLGNGTYCRIYIDHLDGLKGGISSTEGVSAYRSIYSNLQQLGVPDYSAYMGACHCSTVTSGSFGWIQRKGLCWLTPVAYFGDSANERAVQPNTGADGTAQVKGHLANQEVGYLAISTVSGYGDTLTWLSFE
jgi:hypothetical protein